MLPVDELVRSLKRGSPIAFEQLVDRFEEPLYRYFLASVGDEQAAGELTTDCFSELFRALPKMTGGGSELRPFVFAVARNLLRRRWRNAKPASEPTHDVSDWRTTPAEACEARDELRRVLNAIQSLDEATRDVFLLCFVDGLAYAEVAKIVGQPLGTVKSRVHRGRKRLRELLEINPNPANP